MNFSVGYFLCSKVVSVELREQKKGNIVYITWGPEISLKQLSCRMGSDADVLGYSLL